MILLQNGIQELNEKSGIVGGCLKPKILPEIFYYLEIKCPKCLERNAKSAMNMKHHKTLYLRN